MQPNMSRSWLTPVLAVVLAISGCDSFDFGFTYPDVEYVAFGDSATAGPSDRDYPDILRQRLGVSAAAFANEGHSGETTEEGLERLEQILDAGKYPNAKIMLYWEGGNDIVDTIGDLDPFLLFSPTSNDYPNAATLAKRLGEIEDNLRAAIKLGKNAGLTVYVANYFSIRESTFYCEAVALDILLPGQAALANEYVDLLNERIADAAAAEGAVLVDIAEYSPLIADDENNYHNCNHLSAEGNAIVAGIFYDALK